MTLENYLTAAAFEYGIITDEPGSAPETEPIIRDGSDLIYRALEQMSDGQGAGDPYLVQACCCYLFGKGVESVIAWSQAKDGKFSIVYSPDDLTDPNLHAEEPKGDVEIVQESYGHGKKLFQAHIRWCQLRSNDSEQIDFKASIKELLLLCSKFGVAYGLKQKYHELPSGDKGAVHHEPGLSADTVAAAEAGVSFYQGKGVARDLEKALEYLRTAADGGHSGSQYGLAMMFFRGEGTTQNHEMALYWFVKAAENGFAYAQHEASIMLFNGTGCKSDPERAFYWCKKAADQNLPAAIFNMGLFLWNGNGVERDDEQALSHFRKAASMGHQGAKEALEQLGRS
jgi:hypothetical protein